MDGWDEAALAQIDALIDQRAQQPRTPLLPLAAEHQPVAPPAWTGCQPLPGPWAPRQPPPALPQLPPLPPSDAAGPSGHQPVAPPAWTGCQPLLGPWAPRQPPPAYAAGQAAAAAAAGAACPPWAPAELRPPPQPFDPATIGRWIFPTNVTERAYQFEMSSVAVRHNTLVSLPTGLGKTLVAAVVMFNFHRWFPTGRCVFLAPTKPLVHQQVSAVRRIIGLPLAEFAELTGSMKVESRRAAWHAARLLFLTPQTLQNDLETGICPGHEVVCVVVDEAHKATGNHSYVKVVQLLSRLSGGFRVLALSATPANTAEKLQEVISALRIHRLEARDEHSIDVMGVLNERQQQTIRLTISGGCADARDAVGRVYSGTLRRLHGLVFETDVTKMPRFMLVTAQQRYVAVRPEGTPPHIHFKNIALFSLAIMMAQAYELINAYGCGSTAAFLSTYLGRAPTDDFDQHSGGDSEDDDDDDDNAAAQAARGRGRGAGRGANGRGGGGGKAKAPKASGRKEVSEPAVGAAALSTPPGVPRLSVHNPAQPRPRCHALSCASSPAGLPVRRAIWQDGRMLQRERTALYATDDFRTMVEHVDRCAQAIETSHPKLPQTMRLLTDHFEAFGQSSRVMVFCSYRYGVFELLKWLDLASGTPLSSLAPPHPPPRPHPIHPCTHRCPACGPCISLASQRAKGRRRRGWPKRSSGQWSKSSARASTTCSSPRPSGRRGSISARSI